MELTFYAPNSGVQIPASPHFLNVYKVWIFSNDDMKALDIYFIVKDLQGLLGAKLDKVYQQEEDFVMSFHKKEKILLKINPEACFLTQYKFEQEKPPSFCMLLRKHLNQTRVNQIVQRGFERIIEIRLKKEEEYVLIIEIFSKGNIILCKPNMEIIMPLHMQEWKDRTIKPRVTYVYPPRMKFNPLEMKEEDLQTLSKESIVKALAIDFGLGGDYAEEACLRAGINKDKPSVTPDEAKKIVSSVKSLFEEQPSPNRSGLEVYSFKLKTKPEEKKPYATLSEAWDDYYKEGVSEDKSFEKKKKKIEELILKQKQHLEELRKSSEQDKLKGDLIYNNYPYVKEVLDTIKEARAKKISWEEITQKLKTRGIEVKQGGKVVLDLK